MTDKTLEALRRQLRAEYEALSKNQKTVRWCTDRIREHGLEMSYGEFVAWLRI